MNVRRHRVGLLAFAALLGAAMTLSGCATGTGTSPATEPPAPTLLPDAADDPRIPSEFPDEVETVPDGDQTSLAPVALTRSSAFPSGVEVEIEDIKSRPVKANGPGEVPGPGLQLRVRISNETASPMSLDEVTVALTYGPDDIPSVPGGPSQNAPFSGMLKPGDSASGVYLFGVPKRGSDPITVSVAHTVDEPYVVFRGDAR